MIQEAWDHRALVLTVAVAFLTATCLHQRDLLAARPEIHDESEAKVQIVRVAGPVRVETKTIFLPGGEREVVRVVERGATTTTTDRDTHTEHDVKPACPSASAPWRYAGVAVDPLGGFMPRRLEGGVTWFNRFDTGLDYDFKYHAAGLHGRLRF